MFAQYTGKKGKKRLFTAIRDDMGGHFQDGALNALRHLEPDTTAEITVEKRVEGQRLYLHYVSELQAFALKHYAADEAFERWFPKTMASMVECAKAVAQVTANLVARVIGSKFRSD